MLPETLSSWVQGAHTRHPALSWARCCPRGQCAPGVPMALSCMPIAGWVPAAPRHCQSRLPATAPCQGHLPTPLPRGRWGLASANTVFLLGRHRTETQAARPPNGFTRCSRLSQAWEGPAFLPQTSPSARPCRSVGHRRVKKQEAGQAEPSVRPSGGPGALAAAEDSCDPQAESPSPAPTPADCPLPVPCPSPARTRL